MAGPRPIPITIIAGFLGAGKTTLLNRLLTADHGRRLAVLVNDFGDVNIDTQILDAAGVDGLVDLPNGCVCCTLARDLVRVVHDLIEIDNPPEQIILEASGVSSPADIESILDVPALASRVKVEAIITLVDAENILRLAKATMFADKQVAAADIVLLNKIDLVDEEELAAVLAWIAQVAPQARLIKTDYAQAPLELIVGAGSSVRTGHARLAPLAIESRAGHHAFETWTFRSDRPLSVACLEKVLAALPASIYRAKGILYLARDPGQRYVLQVVGKRVTMTADRRWGDTEPGSELVFIGDQGATDSSKLDHVLTECAAR
jgi:G3E family GTPase